MNEIQIKKLTDLNILKLQLNGNEYRLQRPLEITVPKMIIDKLSNIYVKNKEKGGLLEFAAMGGGKITCVAFHELPNLATTTFNFNPNQSILESKAMEIMDKCNIPIVVHTHPTELGIGNYDSKRVNFYVKSSKPDRQVSRNGLLDFLNMPEMIFVKDERYKEGFKISFYTGGIFPQSSSSISTLQYVAGGTALLINNTLVRALAVGVALFDFIRRPRYIYLESGVVVTLTA